MLICSLLDYQAAVEHGTGALIGAVGAVGMQRVGVIAGHEHRGGKRSTIILFVKAQAFIYACERIAQEGRHGTLLGTRSNFLVIKTSKETHIVLVGLCEHGLERSIGTGKVVEFRCRDKFVCNAPYTGTLAVHQKQVARQDVGNVHTQLIGDHLVERARRKRAGGDEGAQVAGAIGRKAIVDVAVHVNSKAGNNGDIAVKREQTALHARARAHKHATRKRQRAIKPGVVDHTAIGFYIKAQIALRSLELAHRLNLERRGIAMGRSELKMIGGGSAGLLGSCLCDLRAHVPGDDARVVATRIVAPAAFDGPCGALG